MIEILPSILSADFAKLSNEVSDVEEDVDLIHVDVMDGHFVPEITIGASVVRAIDNANSISMDVHLMVKDPIHLLPSFLKAGADYISVHAEACTHLHRAVQMIREGGAKAGVALNPATPISSIEPILDDIDYLLIMTVDPGYGGQTFIRSMIEKIHNAHELIISKNLPILIEVDGGINKDTLPLCLKAGASMFVAGSAIFGQKNRHQAIKELLRSALPDGVHK